MATLPNGTTVSQQQSESWEYSVPTFDNRVAKESWEYSVPTFTNRVFKESWEYSVPTFDSRVKSESWEDKASISGTVVDSSGNTIEGATVYVFDGNFEFQGSVTTTAGGTWSMELSANSVNVFASYGRAEYNFASQSVVFP